MSSYVIIRDASPADHPAVLDIYNSTIPSRSVTADLEPVTLEQRGAWFAAHGPERYPLWVAQQHGRVIGWLSFSPYLPRPAYWPTAEVSVYVHEKHRRAGVGRMLLRQAVEFAPRLNLRNLVGLIFAHNEPSLRLCASLGFERWGLLPRACDMDGVERDVVIMGRRV